MYLCSLLNGQLVAYGPVSTSQDLRHSPEVSISLGNESPFRKLLVQDQTLSVLFNTVSVTYFKLYLSYPICEVMLKMDSQRQLLSIQ